eukprot:gnl/MRDRNA2_/MRDRNA2_129366_c0_seq1.p1 gnl/MRDRNA2_/MRDRNA2_129366_c0~~gnl/MRDRNA2_/MRDRNA2_129366_c0_seq1.p1  ORF type:complete len:1025 (+),score=153.69 gnl/MRDRNA2_/MRDRNA2_129366_c0_seq1:208-3075(+)
MASFTGSYTSESKFDGAQSLGAQESEGPKPSNSFAKKLDTLLVPMRESGGFSSANALSNRNISARATLLAGSSNKLDPSAGSWSKRSHDRGSRSGSKRSHASGSSQTGERWENLRGSRTSDYLMEGSFGVSSFYSEMFGNGSQNVEANTSSRVLQQNSSANELDYWYQNSNLGLQPSENPGIEASQASKYWRSSTIKLKSQQTFNKFLSEAFKFSMTTSLDPAVGPQRQAVQHLVSRPWFDGMMGFVVSVNAVCLAAETEVNDPGSQSFFRLSDLVFLSIFSFELVLRVFAYGLGCLRTPVMMLDAIIVLTGWVTEIIIPLVLSSEPHVDLDVLQTLKVLRVLRAVRVLRMLTMFRDLWLVVQSFFLCLRPLVWTVVFIMIIIFLFAMFAIELIGRGFEEDTLKDNKKLEDAVFGFRSTVPAMVSLFRIMTLDTWHKLVLPLFAAAPWTYLFFLVYIAVSALALMNLVTAIVVDTATQGTAKEEEFQRRVFDNQVQRMSEEIKEMFFLMDADGAGSIDQQEFIEYGLEIKMIQDFCDVFDLDEESAVILFKVMCSGIEVEEQDGEKPEYALDMKALLQGMMKLQRITQDQNTVALVRASRTDQERYNHLKHAFSQGGDVNKLRGSVQGRLEQMDSNIQGLLHRLIPLHGNLKKLCTEFGVQMPTYNLHGGNAVSRQVSEMVPTDVSHRGSAMPFGAQGSVPIGAQVSVGGQAIPCGGSISISSQGLDNRNQKSIFGGKATDQSAMGPTKSGLGGLGSSWRNKLTGSAAAGSSTGLSGKSRSFLTSSFGTNITSSTGPQVGETDQDRHQHQTETQSTISSWCGSEMQRVATERSTDVRRKSVDEELQTINRTVDCGVKELRRLITSHLNEMELKQTSGAVNSYPIDQVCEKLSLPAPILELFESEGIREMHELAVLPQDIIHQFLERPEAMELTFGQRGRLLLELSGIRHGCDVYL